MAKMMNIDVDFCENRTQREKAWQRIHFATEAEYSQWLGEMLEKHGHLDRNDFEHGIAAADRAPC